MIASSKIALSEICFGSAGREHLSIWLERLSKNDDLSLIRQADEDIDAEGFSVNSKA